MWSAERVLHLIAERDAARAALLAVVQHCFPAGVGPAVLARCDPVWRRAGAVLWGDPQARCALPFSRAPKPL